MRMKKIQKISEDDPESERSSDKFSKIGDSRLRHFLFELVCSIVVTKSESGEFHLRESLSPDRDGRRQGSS
jgi:hypothetical protein